MRPPLVEVWLGVPKVSKKDPPAVRNTVPLAKCEATSSAGKLATVI